MVISINYSDDKFKNAQKLNSKMALKFGADKVIEYSPAQISDEYKRKNCDIFKYSRGGGYWIWKPYIIKATLDIMQPGDYLIYTDSGSAFVQPISFLLDAMNKEKTDVMVFCIDQLEIMWSKRDALVLMDCDKKEIFYNAQICSGYIILRNTSFVKKLIDEFMEYAQDRRIVTDDPNVLGYDNYPEFKENRHDQTIWSLLCKKYGIKSFRDPSEWGVDKTLFEEDVLLRSDYPQVIDSHRNPTLKYGFQLPYNQGIYYKTLRFIYRCITTLYKFFHFNQ